VIPLQIYTCVFSMINLKIIFRSHNWSALLRFTNQNCVCISYFPHGYCSTHFNLLDIITLKILDQDKKLWSSYLCGFLHFCYLSPKILSSMLFLNATWALWPSELCSTSSYGSYLTLCEPGTLRHIHFASYQVSKLNVAASLNW
jgi:hypothetical protein